MLSISTMRYSLILFFLISSPLSAMQMSEVDKLEEILQSKLSMASDIAIVALNRMRNNNTVSHEIVDVLIRYADKYELALLPYGPDDADTYVVQQMKKKAEEVALSDTESDADQDTPEKDETELKRQSQEELREKPQERLLVDRKSIMLTQRRSRKIEKIAEKIERDLNRFEQKKTHKFPKKQVGISSYLKWGGLCFGITCLAYYFYHRKDKRVGN